MEIHYNFNGRASVKFLADKAGDIEKLRQLMQLFELNVDDHGVFERVDLHVPEPDVEIVITELDELLEKMAVKHKPRKSKSSKNDKEIT